MPSLARTQPRPDLSQEHVTPEQLGGLDYTVGLGAWHWPADMNKRELRWCAFFAAINRAGDVGWKGYRGSIGALTAAEGNANHQTCSTRTTYRALAGLEANGYITRSLSYVGHWRPWTPDGDGRRDAEVVITFTDKLTAIWSGAAPYLQAVPSPAPDPESTDVAGDGDTTEPRSTRSEVSDLEAVPVSDISHRVTKWQGDDLPRSEPPFRGLHSGFQNHHTGDDPYTCDSQRVDRGSVVSPSPATSVDSGSGAGEGEGSKRRATRNGRAALSRCHTPKTHKQLANRILHTLQTIGRQKKDSAWPLARAALELSDPQITPLRSGVDWDYWIARWGDMSRAEREYFARREIWPLLAMRPELPDEDLADELPDHEDLADELPDHEDLADARARLAGHVERGEMIQGEADELLRMHRRTLWRRRGQ